MMYDHPIRCKSALPSTTDFIIQKSMQSGTNMIYLSFHDRMKYAFEDQDTLLASVEF